jgi:hypothetical protein
MRESRVFRSSEPSGAAPKELPAAYGWHEEKKKIGRAAGICSLRRKSATWHKWRAGFLGVHGSNRTDVVGPSSPGEIAGSPN